MSPTAAAAAASAAVLRFLDDLPVPREDPGTVREKADDILSRPEYREPSETLWDRINEAVSDAMTELLRFVGLGSGGVAPVVAWLLLAVLIGAVAALVVWAVSSGRWGEGRRTRDEGQPVIVATDAYRTARDWLSDAEKHEAEGRWSEGLLCRYRSLVVALVEREVIPEQAGRTAGEFVRDVKQHHASGAAPFAAATELFEAAWYGGATTGPDERDRFVALTEQVLHSQEIGASR